MASARGLGRLAKSLLWGGAAGLLFSVAMIVLIVGGLREPYTTGLLLLGGAAVFLTTYLRASRRRGKPD